ncbi:hypothetical protein B0O99DRAFT_684079 [Bisporella sp. PMI_857]|nr:hypothetical protein B0O99DRAFT_684079 [Bisporella sp. PMI_857]
MDDNNPGRRALDEQSFLSGSGGVAYGLPSQRQPQESTSNRPPVTHNMAASNPGLGAGQSYTPYYPAQPTSFSVAPAAQQYSAQSGYTQESQRQAQSYSGYGNAPEALYNNSVTSSYSTSGQFNPRPGNMGMIADTVNSFYPNTQPSLGVPSALQHQASSGSTAAYQPSTPERGLSTQQGYPSTSHMGGMTQAPVAQAQDTYQPPAESLETAYNSYQDALKKIFQNIVEGQLPVAGRSLLEISRWLLGNVELLGLTADEKSLHGDRITLWGEFNTAWIGIFTKQIQMIESMETNQSNLIPANVIQSMGDELIRLNDAIEGQALVDYQYGVAEEQILDVMTQCLDYMRSPSS